MEDKKIKCTGYKGEQKCEDAILTIRSNCKKCNDWSHCSKCHRGKLEAGGTYEDLGY